MLDLVVIRVHLYIWMCCIESKKGENIDIVLKLKKKTDSFLPNSRNFEDCSEYEKESQEKMYTPAEQYESNMECVCVCALRPVSS